MDVVVLGGHGKIGLRLLRLLAEGGHRARGIVRKTEQEADLVEVGAEAIVLDVENRDIAPEHLDGADAVVFAAGAGPGSGPERKRTVDYGGAVKLIEAAKANGISRYVMVSAMGAGSEPGQWPEQMRPYYEAKADADRELAASGLAYTIVRPGILSDEDAAGRVAVSPNMEGAGESVPRADVAAVLLEVLGADNTVEKTFDLLAGPTPIPEAIAAI